MATSSALRARSIISSSTLLQLRSASTLRPLRVGGRRVAKRDNGKTVSSPKSTLRKSFPLSRPPYSPKASASPRETSSSRASYPPKSTFSPRANASPRSTSFRANTSPRETSSSWASYPPKSTFSPRANASPKSTSFRANASPKSTSSFRTNTSPKLTPSPRDNVAPRAASSKPTSSKGTPSPNGDSIFDTSTPVLSSKALPTDFISPPLLPGLLQSLKETLGQDVTPTAIQALSLKHLFKQPTGETKWKEVLLASETGSGKSIAYLLPLLQDLKRTDVERSDSSPKASAMPLNPRALVLAPTHELSRQLAGFAKQLSHIIKLRILCASRANTQSTTRNRGTASKLKKEMDVVFDNDETGDVTISPRGRSHDVDVLVGTPMKLLELEKGKGWNWEQRAQERALKFGGKHAEEKSRKFWVDKPEMGLGNVEWVIIDEADVLFDSDFEQSTRQLLADIAAARGQPVSVLPVSPVSLQNARSTSGSPQPVSYPFNLLLTSATIPNSLSNYLSTYHPALIRLASPNVHHLPTTLRTEHAKWTGGNKDADIEHRIRRVWAEDSLAHAKSAGSVGSTKLSKIIVFCNKKSKVEQLSDFLDSRGIKSVALTGEANARTRGSNRHLDGFLKSTDSSATSGVPSAVPKSASSTPAGMPHVLITTSLLSRGLDFSPAVKHVFIVDEPRNMIDFLHRAGRTGRAGEAGKVVVFGRAKGRGSGRTEEMRKRVRALL